MTTENQSPTAQSGPSYAVRLLQAVRATNWDGVVCDDVDGQNWFDAARNYIYELSNPPAGARDAVTDGEKFADWLAREMPSGTIIGNPYWWAPRIIRALRSLTSKADDFPECSGTPNDCPENEGHGCCKATQPAASGAGEYDRDLIVTQALLDWNRALPDPIIRVGFEYVVAAECLRFVGAQALAAQPAPVEEGLPANVYKHPTLGGLLCNATGVPEWLHNCGCPIHSEQPAPGVGGRVDASEALQSLADYFRRTGDLWEGPDGCAERGTVLCDEIRDRLEKLAREPMALGLTKIPLFPALAPTRPAESVAQGGDAAVEIGCRAICALHASNPDVPVPQGGEILAAWEMHKGEVLAVLRAITPTPATGSGGEES